MSDEVFATTIERLRNLPGLSSEPQQDLDNLEYMYKDAKQNELRRGIVAALKLARTSVGLGMGVPDPIDVFNHLKGGA